MQDLATCGATKAPSRKQLLFRGGLELRSRKTPRPCAPAAGHLRWRCKADSNLPGPQVSESGVLTCIVNHDNTDVTLHSERQGLKTQPPRSSEICQVTITAPQPSNPWPAKLKPCKGRQVFDLLALRTTFRRASTTT